MRRLTILLLLFAAGAVPAAAQRTVDWDTRFLFYSDNTEFFNPYREGATWMGARLWTELALQAAPNVEVRVGVSADHLSGDSSFAKAQPLLSIRYRDEHSTGVLGTLIVEDRHGLIEPFMVLQRDILQPVEYGSQWIERHDRWGAEFYLNWRALNIPTQREHFDMGLLTHADALPWLRLGFQGLWVHRGGQLYAAGQSTSNNIVVGLGLTAHDTLGPLGATSVEAWYLTSSPGWPDSLPAGVDAKGEGTLLRASVSPLHNIRFTGVLWHGNGFSATAGDPNYNSVGRAGYYKRHRFYAEVGMNQVWTTINGVSLESQFRFHKIDDIDTDAISWTKWEYSYRLMAKVPFSFRVWSEAKAE